MGASVSFRRPTAILIVMTALVGAGGWLWSSYGQNETESESTNATKTKAVPVIVETVNPLPASTSVEAIGTGSALRSIDVFSAVTGRVTEVAFVAGQMVAQDDILLRLDNQAETLAVQLAEVEVRRARQLLDRYKKAAPTGGIPASEVDAARTDLDRVQIQLDQARVAAADRVIRAPFPGTVGMPLVDPGDRVSSATLITTLDDRSEILVSFNVPEIHAGRIVPSMPITLTAWSLPGQDFIGAIESAGSRLDPQSRTLAVRARVRNDDDLLRPGMSFGVRFKVPGHPYPAVNEVAVMWGKGGAYVWRINTDNTAEKIAVTIIRRDGPRVLIDGPVAKGDRIVIEGVQSLRPGALVKIVPSKLVSG